MAGLLIILYAAIIKGQAAEAEALLGFTAGIFTLARGSGCIIFGALVHAANRVINLLTEIRDNQTKDSAHKPRPTPAQITETKKTNCSITKKLGSNFPLKIEIFYDMSVN